MSPTYKFNYPTQPFNYENTNTQNDTTSNNKNNTSAYDEAPKQFLTESKDTHFDATKYQTSFRPTSNFSTSANANNASSSMSKPAFLNSYKFMSHTLKDESATNNNSATNSILYSPKVFQNEGTNSRYSSASSLDHEEIPYNRQEDKHDDDDEEEAEEAEEEECQNQDQEEDPADQTGNNLNLTTKPMNTPAGFGSMSGASLIEDDEESSSNSHSNRSSSASQKNIASLLVHENAASELESTNKLELGILDLENFISELYAQSSSPAPSAPSQTLVMPNRLIQYVTQFFFICYYLFLFSPYSKYFFEIRS